MRIRIYLYRSRFLLPTIGQIAEGFLKDIEPVHEIPQGDSDALGKLIEVLLVSGNPTVAAPAPRDRSKPPLVKKSGAKSWRAFELEARAWALNLDGNYGLLIPYTLHPDGGFEQNLSAAESFDLRVGVQAVARRISELAAEVQK